MLSLALLLLLMDRILLHFSLSEMVIASVAQGSSGCSHMFCHQCVEILLMDWFDFPRAIRITLCHIFWYKLISVVIKFRVVTRNNALMLMTLYLSICALHPPLSAFFCVLCAVPFGGLLKRAQTSSIFSAALLFTRQSFLLWHLSHQITSLKPCQLIPKPTNMAPLTGVDGKIWSSSSTLCSSHPLFIASNVLLYSWIIIPLLFFMHFYN